MGAYKLQMLFCKEMKGSFGRFFGFALQCCRVCSCPISSLPLQFNSAYFLMAACNETYCSMDNDFAFWLIHFNRQETTSAFVSKCVLTAEYNFNADATDTHPMHVTFQAWLNPFVDSWFQVGLQHSVVIILNVCVCVCVLDAFWWMTEEQFCMLDVQWVLAAKL